MKPLIGSTNVKLAAGMGVVAMCLVISAGHIAAARSSSDASGAVIGSPARVEAALDADATAALLAREGKTRSALGFPIGVSRVGHHVQDGFESAQYDEVTELDSAGRVESVTQFDSKGRLRSAVRLDVGPATGARVAQDVAVKSAQSSALAAGLAIGIPTSTDADQATRGWTVHWARTQGGVRVRGDETRVQVWPDGSIESVARVEHDLAIAGAIVVAVADLNLRIAGISFTLLAIFGAVLTCGVHRRADEQAVLGRGPADRVSEPQSLVRRPKLGLRNPEARPGVGRPERRFRTVEDRSRRGAVPARLGHAGEAVRRRGQRRLAAEPLRRRRRRHDHRWRFRGVT